MVLETVKHKKERMVMITDELIVLWEKFSFPTLSKQTIIYKIYKLIKVNDKDRKKKKDSFQVEHKLLYNLQVESQGKVGYVTSKVTPQLPIHPSK